MLLRVTRRLWQIGGALRELERPVVAAHEPLLLRTSGSGGGELQRRTTTCAAEACALSFACCVCVCGNQRALTYLWKLGALCCALFLSCSVVSFLETLPRRLHTCEALPAHRPWRCLARKLWRLTVARGSVVRVARPYIDRYVAGVVYVWPISVRCLCRMHVRQERGHGRGLRQRRMRRKRAARKPRRPF